MLLLILISKHEKNFIASYSSICPTKYLFVYEQIHIYFFDIANNTEISYIELFFMKIIQKMGFQDKNK